MTLAGMCWPYGLYDDPVPFTCIVDDSMQRTWMLFTSETEELILKIKELLGVLVLWWKHQRHTDVHVFIYI